MPPFTSALERCQCKKPLYTSVYQPQERKAMQQIIITIPDGVEVIVNTIESQPPEKPEPASSQPSLTDRAPAKQAIIGKEYTIRHNGRVYTLVAAMVNDAAVYYVNDLPFRSPTAAAKWITGQESISGPRFWGFE